MSKESSLPLRLAKGFARFWWDFLIGDTPEIFVAVVVIIAVTAMLSEVGHFNTVAIVALPLLAMYTLARSLRRVVRQSRPK
jgi:hypothetical protein